MIELLSNFRMTIFCPNCEEPVVFWETLKTQCFQCLEKRFEIKLILITTDEESKKKEEKVLK